MIKNIILKHQEEKEKLRSRATVKREKLEEGKKMLQNDLIKVITGPRRAGKSVFSVSMLEGKEFIYLNFDDENLLKMKNYEEIMKGIHSVVRHPQYIVFDEIQNLPQWELFVNKLHRRGYYLIITGSNAHLLQKELGTVLTGRYLPLEVLPFSFREYLHAKNIEISERENQTEEYRGMLQGYLHDYMVSGGFPEVVTKNLGPQSYLETLFEAVLLTDIVKRHRIREIQQIYDLALLMATQFASEISYGKLKNVLNLKSVSTVEKYVHYLQEAYLFFSLNRFSFKFREQIKAPRKNYLIDTGFASAKSFRFSPDNGRFMENIIAIELVRRGYIPGTRLFSYKTRNQKEVDFVLRKGLKVNTLIQSCYDLNVMVKKREFSALYEAGDELNCEDLMVLTWDATGEEKFKNKTIQFKSVLDWLVEK